MPPPPAEASAVTAGGAPPPLWVDFDGQDEDNPAKIMAESRNSRLVAWAECAVAAGLTAFIVYLHAYFRQHAGGLWRDEVNTVHLANLPSLADTWHYLQFDSFPILIFSVVRGWTALFSGSDASLRTYGCLVGVAIFIALWWNARLFGHRLPLLSLLLLGSNPLFIRYADSLRAYGLGILLMLLTLGAVWRVVESLRPGRVLLAAVLAVLSVQALYYNSVLLLSMCGAGAITAAWDRDWKKAACVLGIGAPAAASLLVYAATIHGLHEWNALVQYPVTLAWIWQKLSDVTGSPDPVGVWVWSALFIGALALAAWQVPWRSFARRQPLTPRQRVLLFAACTLALGTIAYAEFLQTLNYHTQPWYYVTYLALAAVTLDAVYGSSLPTDPRLEVRWRGARLAFVWAFGALTLMQARTDLFTRQTNLDLVAHELTADTRPGDIVINERWECDITFEHYYRGPAEDLTLPPLSDHRFHRYDLVLQQMLTPDAARPVLAKMERTLRDGHRVWFVGQPTPRAPGEDLPILDSRPHGNVLLYQLWAMQATDVLVQHATSATGIKVPVPGLVSGFEDLPLSVYAGWH